MRSCTSVLPLFLAALLAVATNRAARAALCEDYPTQVDCDGKVVDTGDCVWQASNATCRSDGSGLPEGTVAVTSVEGPSSEPAVGFPTLPTNSAFCSEPADPGLCRAAIPAWFYNEETQACEEFTFGGCVANSNAFETRDACDASSQQFCSGGSVAASPRQTDGSFCTQPAEVGACRGAFPSFYYNSSTGECTPFIYGGCDGNDNRFDTIEDCQAASQKYCSSARGAALLYATLVGILVFSL